MRHCASSQIERFEKMSEEAASVFDALNVLGSCPFRINKKVNVCRTQKQSKHCNWTVGEQGKKFFKEFPVAQLESSGHRINSCLLVILVDWLKILIYIAGKNKGLLTMWLHADLLLFTLFKELKLNIFQVLDVQLMIFKAGGNNKLNIPEPASSVRPPPQLDR